MLNPTVEMVESTFVLTRQRREFKSEIGTRNLRPPHPTPITPRRKIGNKIGDTLGGIRHAYSLGVFVWRFFFVAGVHIHAFACARENHLKRIFIIGEWQPVSPKGAAAAAARTKTRHHVSGETITMGGPRFLTTLGRHPPDASFVTALFLQQKSPICLFDSKDPQAWVSGLRKLEKQDFSFCTQQMWLNRNGPIKPISPLSDDQYLYNTLFSPPPFAVYLRCVPHRNEIPGFHH